MGSSHRRRSTCSLCWINGNWPQRTIFEEALDFPIMARCRVPASSTPTGVLAMCGCSTHQSKSTNVVDTNPNALPLRVEDMTWGHCAATIAQAVEAGIPGAVVDADPASKTVRVSGTTDLAAVRVLIAGAGYTPAEAILA